MWYQLAMTVRPMRGIASTGDSYRKTTKSALKQYTVQHVADLKGSFDRIRVCPCRTLGSTRI